MRLPGWVVPALVVLATAAGVAVGRVMAVPSVTMDFAREAASPPVSLATTVFIVNGVRCVDTARKAGAALQRTRGMVRYVSYASRGRVEITYDPSKTDPEVIREAIEGPVYDPETGEILFHPFTVVEIDGVRFKPGEAPP